MPVAGRGQGWALLGRPDLPVIAVAHLINLINLFNLFNLFNNFVFVDTCGMF